MKRKLLSTAIVILSLFSIFAIFANAKTDLPKINTGNPLITYTYKTSGKVYAYKESSLKTKTGGYIACATDECKIIEITSKAVKVKYPVGTGTKTAWFSREAFTYRNLYSEGAKFKFTSKAAATVYKWKNSNKKLGTISKNDTCYLLRGDENSDWLQIIYPVSNGYKMGWITGSSYKSILPIATGISLNKTSATITGIGSTLTLTATVTPSTAIDKTVYWSSSNTSVATVTSGKVTAKNIGSATITAKTVTGKTATCKITVKPVVVTGITLNRTSATLTIGSTTTLSSTVSPSNATYKTVSWSSSNSSVASVSSSGKVTAKNVGTATITAKSHNGKTATCKITVNPIAVTGVALNKTSTILIGKGAVTTLKASVAPSNATYQGISWSSSDNTVATVSASGTVTAVNYGTTTIKAKSHNGKTAICKITVTYPLEDEITVTDVSLDKSSVSLTVCDSTTLKATVLPLNATYQSLTWSSSDDSVASVSSAGVVTAKSIGTATITVTTYNGKTDACKVTVQSVAATKITLNKTSATLTGIGSSSVLTATVSPSNATDKTVTWSSSNNSVATVSNSGKVTAKKLGTTIITTKTANGKTATCKITVVPQYATGIKLHKTSLILNGKKAVATLSATIYPNNTTDKTIKWSSSNSSIAKISSSGKVTAVNNGTVTITAKTSNGKTATCKITVSNVKATSIKLSKSTLSLSVGETYTVNSTISPSNSTDEVMWSTSNKSVATVSSSGKITAKKVGSATITAKTTSGKKVTVKVTVSEYISLSNIDKIANKYNIKTNSNAYKALLSINTKYSEKLTTSNKNGVVIFIFEGLGNNSSSKKRMNAMCVVIKNKKIVYFNRNSSTIPDYPFTPSKNQGKDMPTIKSGIYNFTTVNHQGKYAALNVSNAKVVRFKSKKRFYSDTSYGINVHRRSTNTIAPSNKTWVNSAGCIIIGKEGKSINDEYGKFIKTVGIISSSAKSYSKYTKYVTGKIIIDRSYAKDYLSNIGYSSKAIKMLG